jgi:hypothetical protein
VPRPLTCHLQLLLLFVAEGAEGRNAVGLRPNANRSHLGECLVLYLKQRLAVKEDLKARADELDTRGMPLIWRHCHLDPIYALVPNGVERTARPVHRLLANHIVLKGVGSNTVVAIGILGAPQQTTCAVLRARKGLELRFDEAICVARFPLRADDAIAATDVGSLSG